MELKIYSPNEAGQLAPIDFNYDEIRAYLEEALTKYNNMVYTDDSISLAKEDRAKLNKLKTAIEDRRKAIKKIYLQPYETFEIRIKELVALIEKPTLAIDSEIKSYEESKREEKRLEIEKMYLSNIGGLEELLPLAKIFNDKWLNATTTLKSIEKELAGTIEKVAADIQVIDDLNSEYALQIKDMYIRTLDLSAALREKTRLEEQKAKLEKYQEKQDELNRGNSVDETETQKGTTSQEVEEKPTTETPQAQNGTEEVLERIEFVVLVTQEQKKAMRQFFIDNKIKFEK